MNTPLRRALRIVAIACATLVLAVAALVVWVWRVELPRQTEAILAKLDNDIVLAADPLTFGPAPLHLRAATPMVVNRYSEVCAALTRTVKREEDEKAQLSRLLGGVRLGAVFHERGGRDHEVTDTVWMFRGQDSGTLFACLHVRCPCKEHALPADGTVIDAIDLHATGPLHVERVIWTAPGYIDPSLFPPPPASTAGRQTH
jgi:hypothetical protein